MIRLPDTNLKASAVTLLAKYQAEIDAIPDYAKRVAAASKEWGKRNTAKNAAFRDVRKTLETMCCGARRCGYCEDSAADEIDHVRPKSFYPEATFVWENYIYTCGLCNGPKNNQFAVFTDPNGEFSKLQRGPKDTPTSPLTGDMVLIHPRQENPLDFLILDLRDTFEFFPLYEQNENAVVWQRADYTINLLTLNTRDYLPKARRSAYRDFRARLHEYARKRDAGATPDELVKLTEAFLSCNHQGVWQEMKRQGSQIPELKALFTEVPDALTW